MQKDPKRDVLLGSFFWCPKADSNRHASRRLILSQLCLPFHHSGEVLTCKFYDSIEARSKASKKFSFHRKIQRFIKKTVKSDFFLNDEAYS